MWFAGVTLMLPVASLSASSRGRRKTINIFTVMLCMRFIYTYIDCHMLFANLRNPLSAREFVPFWGINSDSMKIKWLSNKMRKWSEGKSFLHILKKPKLLPLSYFKIFDDIISDVTGHVESTKGALKGLTSNRNGNRNITPYYKIYLEKRSTLSLLSMSPF